MKHPLETLLSAAGILLLALLSCLLARAFAGPDVGAKAGETFHMMDLNQLYTVLFCLWFLALGAIEYLVLRWVWRRWFSSSKTRERASVGATVVLFAVGARRLIEGPGKGLLRIKAILE